MTNHEVGLGNQLMDNPRWDEDIFDMEPEQPQFPANLRNIAVPSGEAPDTIRWLTIAPGVIGGTTIGARLNSVSGMLPVHRLGLKGLFFQFNRWRLAIQTAGANPHRNQPRCQNCAHYPPALRNRCFGGFCESKIKVGSGLRAACTTCEARGAPKCSVINKHPGEDQPEDTEDPFVAAEFQTPAEVHKTMVQWHGVPTAPHEEDPVAATVTHAARLAIGSTALYGRGWGTIRRNSRLTVSGGRGLDCSLS